MSVGSLISSANLPFTPTRLAYSADGTWLAAAGLVDPEQPGRDGGVAVINAATGRPRWLLDLPGPTALEFTPDGRHVVVGAVALSGGGRGSLTFIERTVRLLRAESGAEVWLLPDVSAFEVVVSPDSELIAIVDGRGGGEIGPVVPFLMLLDATSGQPLHHLGPTFHLRLRPVFSADSQRVLISTDGAVRLVSCTSGEPQASMESPGVVQTTLLDIDQEILAVRADGGLIRRHINATAGAVETALEGAARIAVDPNGLSRFAPVSFSPDGTRVAAVVPSIGFLGGFRLGVFDTGDGRAVFTGQLHLPGHAGEAGGATLPSHMNLRVVFSPDGRLVAANGFALPAHAAQPAPAGPFLPGGFTVLEAASGLLVTRGETDEIRDLAFAPDACRLAVGGFGFVRVHDVGTLRSTALLGVPVTRLAVRASATGAGVVAAIGEPAGSAPSGGSSAAPPEENLALFQAETGARLWAQHLHPGALRWLGFDATGETLVVADSSGAVRVLRTLSGEQRGLISHGDAVRGIAISPGTGSWLATASQDKTARRINLPEGTEGWQARHPRSVSHVAISSDDRLVATACADNAVRVLNASDGVELRRIERQAQVRALAFAPGSSRLGIGYADSSVTVVDAGTGSAAAAPLTLSAPVTALAFSPDGTLGAVAAGASVRVYAVEPQSATLIVEITRREPVILLAFHPVDAQLTVVTESPALISYDPHTGRERRRVIHPGGVRDAAYSPDGMLFATAGNDGTIRIYPGRIG
jgi:WD40 repeat protein